MKTIVALVDFSDVTATLLDQSVKIATAFGSPLVLLHIVPVQPSVVELGLASPTVMQPPSEKKIEAHYQKLLDLRDDLAAQGAKVSAKQLEEGSIDALMRMCGELGAELIVVGTHHHSSLYNLIVGTFTSDVLKRATCPVLVVPARSPKPA